MLPRCSRAVSVPSDVEHTSRESVLGVICAACAGSERSVDISLPLALP